MFRFSIPNFSSDFYNEYLRYLDQAITLHSEFEKRKAFLDEYNYKIIACLNLRNGSVCEKIISNLESLPDEVLARIKTSEWSINSYGDLNDLKWITENSSKTNLRRWEILTENRFLEYLDIEGKTFRVNSGFSFICSHEKLRTCLSSKYLPYDSLLRDGVLNSC